ncbi:beta-1,3-galactosyltransferase 5-like [Rana temporaria]|uniref:beta-1,3-galactosyltransferase 5-like n=1 Tax=Rana temporaria TaxID=8407 RepID=UPI001AAE07D8|nr:beta-1,3-galactosyltransferase 5-like [Rana temporaria]
MAIRRAWCLKVLLGVTVFSFLLLWSRLLEGTRGRWFRFSAPSGRKGIDFPSLFSQDLPEPRCQTELLLLILVTSKPDHGDSRKAIRRTWASPAGGAAGEWQVVFLVGRTLDVELDWRIHNEQKANCDLLMGDYLDSHRNRTLKVMHGMKWAVDRCRPRYILKTGDDCFVNTLHLPPFLRGRGAAHLYAGAAVPEKKRAVVRDPLSEWYVAYREYLPDVFPPYASGIGYIVSFDAAQSILRAARAIPPVPVEDAYVGILAERAGVRLLTSTRFAKRNVKWSVCNYRFLMVIHGLSPEDQALAMDNLRRTRTSCNHSAEVVGWR